MDPNPLEVRRVDQREVHITWADGHRTVLSNQFLREHCQCARCVNELTGQKLIAPGSIPADIRAEEISLVGRYAVRFRWSDGHDTGIYPFRALRAWCRCEGCRGGEPR